MDTHDWMNSVNLAFSPKKIDMNLTWADINKGETYLGRYKIRMSIST